MGVMISIQGITNWIAPSFVLFLGAHYCIAIGAFIMSLFILMLSFTLHPVPVYIFSIFVGFGLGLLWVGHGTILITNSTSKTIGRNTGIFFFMFQSSCIFGNTIIYKHFDGDEYITDWELTFIHLTKIYNSTD